MITFEVFEERVRGMAEALKFPVDDNLRAVYETGISVKDYTAKKASEACDAANASQSS